MVRVMAQLSLRRFNSFWYVFPGEPFRTAGLISKESSSIFLFNSLYFFCLIEV